MKNRWLWVRIALHMKGWKAWWLAVRIVFAPQKTVDALTDSFRKIARSDPRNLEHRARRAAKPFVKD